MTEKHHPFIQYKNMENTIKYQTNTIIQLCNLMKYQNPLKNSKGTM